MIFKLNTKNNVLKIYECRRDKVSWMLLFLNQKSTNLVKSVDVSTQSCVT